MKLNGYINVELIKVYLKIYLKYPYLQNIINTRGMLNF